MGCSIKFVRLDDFISDIDSIDLSTGGYSLANDGYFQTVAPIGAKSVREVITIKIQGSSKDNLAALIQDIDEKIKQVQWWMDDPGVEKYQVWIRVQLDGETYSRQAQILTIQPPDKVKTFTPTEINNNYIGEYQIGIERTPYWEGAVSTPATKASLDVAGGTSALSAAVAGDVPARLLKFSIYPHSGSSQMSTAWVGFKTSRFGVAANFVPRWKLNNSLYGLDTSAVADATAYTNFRIVTTFSTDATLKTRTTVYSSNVSVTYPEDQRGTFLVLLRAKMSDTSIARARIGYSFSGSFPVYRSRQVISGTAWNLYEMGVVKNPPGRIYNYHNISNFAIEIAAERISGAGALHCDSLILIPIDDGAIKMTASSVLSGAVNNKITVYQAADDKISSLVEVNNLTIYYSALVNPQNNWQLPADATAPIVVVAATDVAGATGNTKNATVDFDYTYITRWRTMRGNTA